MDVTRIVADFGYLAVGLAIFLEDFGLPAPGETVLIAAAIAAGQGELNVFVVGLVGFVAAVFGDNVGFAIGRYAGRGLVLRAGNRVHVGRHVLIGEERLERGERFFERYGGPVVIGARFVEGLRQLNGIIAGIVRLPWARFLIFNVIGAALWVGFWTAGAYLAGTHLSALHAYYRRIVPIVILLAVLAGVAYWWFRRRKALRDPGFDGDP
jgi:membrane protein DedA with SNARE-associated domain